MATSRFAWATTIAILIVAVIAPLLGAIADYAGIKKKLLAVFLGIGVVATARCTGSSAATGCSRSSLFVVGNVGVAGSIVFYESLLPTLVDEPELDRVSIGGLRASATWAAACCSRSTC